jgi:hypothetical protein
MIRQLVIQRMMCDTMLNWVRVSYDPKLVLITWD